MFFVEGVFSVFENGFKEPPNQEPFGALPKIQKIEVMDNRKNDVVALFLIQQGLNEIILPVIAYVTCAKEA